MHSNLMPHPVLRPTGSDYREGCRFEIKDLKPRLTEQGDVVVDVSFKLTSFTLRKMITEHDAKYFVIAKSPRTYYRSCTESADTSMVIKMPDCELETVVTLIPYVVSTRKMPRFDSKDHDDEIRSLSSGTLPPGSILAIGAPYDIDLNDIGYDQSKIQMRRNDAVEEGTYTVEIADEFIVIEMSDLFDQVEQMRKEAPEMLYPSLYQAAIEHAIRNMEANMGAQWAEKLRMALTEHGINPDDEELGEMANIHAQKLLKKPLAKMMGLGWRGEVD